MNHLKKTVLGLLVGLLTVLSGCGSDYFDINQNPNQVTAATPELVLPAALSATARYLYAPATVASQTSSFYFLNLWMGYWNWSGNFSINLSDKNYQFAQDFNNGLWELAYTNLKNYNYIDVQGAALKQPLLQAMGKVMKVYHFQILVDTYGDVPYTDALQGTTSILPKYDKAQDIYDDLVRQLDAAQTLFKQGDGTFNPTTNDIMFGGDISLWQKFTNTLKLRILLRQTERADRAAYLTAQFATLKASPYGFLGAGQNASISPGYTNSDNQQSPLYGAFFAVNGAPTGTNNQYKANGYAISFYKSTNDPRLGAFYAPVPKTTATYNGTLFGTQDVQANSLVSDIGPGVLRSVDQRSPILSSHESLFMQAEAAQRGFISGTAKDLYQAAITESFKNVGRTAAEATTYYSQKGVNNVDFDASANKIEAIITQKWASENSLAPFEAWSDYRRLGLPKDVPISLEPSVTTRQIPNRLLYPQSEYNNNNANVQAEGQVSQFTTKIFWQK